MVSPPLPPMYMDLADVVQVSSSLLMEVMGEYLFSPSRDAPTLHIIMGFGVLAPVALAMKLHSVLTSFQVPSKPLVLLPLSRP
jgi:hypothetical protein